VRTGLGLVPVSSGNAACDGDPSPTKHLRWTALLWQRFPARHALTAEPVEPRWGAGGGTRRPRHVPLVIREPEASWWEVQARSTVTVAAVREGDTYWQPDQVLAQLAQLAVDDELLVVFGSNGRAVQHAIVAGLRDRLPRHDVTPVYVRHRHGQLLRDAATVERLLDSGSVPVVVTPANAMRDVTAEIASYLRADRVLRLLQTTAGAEFRQVWHRAEPSVN
jgi:hypothetical protein